MNGAGRRVNQIGALFGGRGLADASHRLRLFPAVCLLCCLLAILAWPGSADAHAFLQQSTPAANAVSPTPPTPASLRFTEPLEQSYSRVDLYDQTGVIVPGATFRFGDDGNTMLVDFPANLANGTYSLLWRTLSAADGHTSQGYIPFTIGAERDVTTIVPPAADEAAAGAPEYVKSISRWLALLALAAVVAIWPVWLFVIRPAFSPAWQAGPDLTRRARRFATFAILGALIADLIALVVQSLSVLGGGGIFSAIVTTIGQTRYGTFWLIRVGLLLMFSAALVGAAWWWPRRQRLIAGITLLLALLLPIPFSMLSHAAAQAEGRTTAIAFDYVHLLAAATWVGGVLVLLSVLGPSLRSLTAAGRQVVLGLALPRFSLIALIAWATLVLTGLYNASLEVGNLTALTTTPYGQTLLIKLALLLPLLALAAFNLLVVTRRIKRAETEGAATGWSRNLVTALAAEAVLVTVVLAVVGSLIGQPPAREVLAQNAGRLVLPLTANGQQGTLYITPGVVGANHYRLELGNGHEAHLRNQAGTDVTLRFELPAQRTGQLELKLAPAAAGAYENHGSELSIAGDWTIEALVKAEGQPDWDVRSTAPIGLEAAAIDLPPPPLWLGPAGVLGLLLGVLGIAGVIWAILVPTSVMRKEAAGLGVVAIGLAALLIVQARLPESTTASAIANAPGGAAAGLVAVDPAAVERGSPLFASNCATCHGPGGKGDGPLASDQLRPANLTLSHARLHDQATLELWIANGIPGTNMPGFASQLSPEQIDDVIAYLRKLQNDAAQVAESPGAEGCLVAPRSLDQLRAVTESSTAVAATPGQPALIAREEPTAPPATGEPVSTEVADQIHAAIRQLVACTNGGDTMRRLALYSDAQMKRAYPTGPTTTLERIAGTPVPVPDADKVALVDVSDVLTLPDGRISARAVIDNPQFHTHGPAAPGSSGSSEAARLIFVNENGVWKIDQVVQGT